MKAEQSLLIHDMENFPLVPGEGLDIVGGGAPVSPCVGCFGCWVRTPGTCVLGDGYQDMGARFAASDRLVVVSRCVYGGFSPRVKNVLDRCIGYLLPFFTLRSDGQMHHASRYPQRLRLSVHFYGEDITPGERETARRLVERNALNLNAKSHEVRFHREIARAEQLA